MPSHHLDGQESIGRLTTSAGLRHGTRPFDFLKLLISLPSAYYFLHHGVLCLGRLAKEVCIETLTFLLEVELDWWLGNLLLLLSLVRLPRQGNLRSLLQLEMLEHLVVSHRNSDVALELVIIAILFQQGQLRLLLAQHCFRRFLSLLQQSNLLCNPLFLAQKADRTLTSCVFAAERLLHVKKSWATHRHHIWLDSLT